MGRPRLQKIRSPRLFLHYHHNRTLEFPQRY